MCGCSEHTESEAITGATAPDAALFSVPDMTCGHCAGTVKSALADKMPGATVEIDIAKRQVRVAGPKDQAETAIREAGYSPELVH